MIKTWLMCWLVAAAAGVFPQPGDLSELDRALKKAEDRIATSPLVSYRNLESFIVWSAGAIRFEKYYNGASPDSLHHIQSQTKSIVSLLMGIAIDRGLVGSEQETVSRWFPESFNAEDDPMKSSVTIRDLLTMSAGFKWEEWLPFDDPNNDNMNMYNGGKYLSYALSRRMAVKPFTEFKYNSGCPMIVAGIIEKATKMPLDDFAEKYLFGPLKINNYSWLKDPAGFCHAGGGLSMLPADIVKIGILVSNNGKWDGRQVVSEEWIRKVTRSYISTSFDTSGYGYFWWIRDMHIKGNKTIMMASAEGAGGQKLYVFPEYKLIISFTEHNYTTPQVGPLFINESVLPVFD